MESTANNRGCIDEKYPFFNRSPGYDGTIVAVNPRRGIRDLHSFQNIQNRFRGSIDSKKL